MKKLITLLLLSAMILSSFAACGESTSNADEGTTTGTEVTATEGGEEAAAVEETEPKETLDIEVKDYEGRTINIVLAGNWSFDDFIAEEMTGEAINDAKYTTNAAVSELLNVEFVINNQSGQASGGTGTGYKLVDTMVMAGTTDYDIADIGCYDVSNLAYNGKLLDLNAVKNIDLTKSWWDPKANEQLSIGGKMFYSTGDAGLLDNNCTYCILFNKQVITNYNLDDPYELVRENKWTYDKFTSMAEVVQSDLNGNGTADVEDSYGVLVWQDSVIGMLHASGGKFATINDAGQIELTLNSERNFDVLTSWLTLKTQPVVLFLGAATDDEAHAAFTGNRCLFYTRYLNAVQWFRDLEADFGILPYPKWDETQDSFCNTMHAYGTSYFCFPVTVADPEMSGAVLEALSYYGKENITPAYYDTTLKGKYFRDEESAEMLDLIFASRFFDVGTYYQLGGYNEKVITMMQQGDTDFASMYTKNEKAANKVLGKINDAYAAMIAGENP
ncbi:MAG: extracellular solute-binding protein [Ruminococcaceae bacterium]|nr:extracellular solute-binding protein [Oscillospiraceae bacterium]